MIDPALPQPQHVHLDASVVVRGVVVLTPDRAVLAGLQRRGEMLQGAVLPAAVVEAEADCAVEEEQQREQREDALAAWPALSIGAHGEIPCGRSSLCDPPRTVNCKKGTPLSDALGVWLQTFSASLRFRYSHTRRARPYAMIGVSRAFLPGRALLVGAVALAAGPGPGPASPPARLRVVTTLPVLEFLVEEIGGDRVEVDSLADPRQDPYTVEPRPTLMQRARTADVFVEVGLALESWSTRVLGGSGNPDIQVGRPGHIVASAGITTLRVPSILSRARGHIHPYGNPYVWLDPLNAKRMAANIASGLSRIDPVHAEDYARRLQDFERAIDEALFGRVLVEKVGATKLTRLARQGRLTAFLESRELAGDLGGWLERSLPLRGRSIVSYHETYDYFAQRFGFEIAIEIEERPGVSPSVQHRDRVLGLMLERGVRSILLEVYHDRKAAEFLGERTGANVLTIPIDIGAAVGVADYHALIDQLIDRLVESEQAG